VSLPETPDSSVVPKFPRFLEPGEDMEGSDRPLRRYPRSAYFHFE
jgi:hypothetical protein